MMTGNDRAARVLFQSIDDDGTDWLWMFLSDDQWPSRGMESGSP
jgi:hypothetical protein